MFKVKTSAALGGSNTIVAGSSVSHKSTCIVVGDSRNEKSFSYTDGTNASAYLGEKSLYAWLQYISGRQFDLIAAASKAGHDLSECLRDWDNLTPMHKGYSAVGYGFAGVDISAARFAFVMLGVNSFALWNDVDDKARVDAILSKLSAVQTIVWVLEPPCGSGSSIGALTYAQWNANRKSFNAYLRQLTETNPQLILVDLESESIDSLSVDGYCRAETMILDGAGSTMAVHPTSKWYRAAAQKVWDVVKPLLIVRDTLPRSVTETFLVDGTKNSYANTMLNAAPVAASATGATISGVMPPGVAITGTGTGISITASVVPAADGIGNLFVLDMYSTTVGPMVVAINFTDLAAGLNACGVPSKVNTAVKMAFGLKGAGNQDVLPFTAAKPAGAVSGWTRLRRSAYRTSYTLGPSAGATLDTTSGTAPTHTGVFEGVMESGWQDMNFPALATGNFQSGATATFMEPKVKWLSDGTVGTTVRLVLSRPTVEFEE